MSENEERLLTRIFRADTPHDVFCASIVALRLPKGRDYLLINTDYSDGDQGFLECMKFAGAIHEWQMIIDSSGLAINKHHKKYESLVERFKRTIETVKSIRKLRKLLSAALGVKSVSANLERELDEAVDEVYLNCLHHPEVQVFYKIFPSAKFIYYPHGFDSFHQTELNYYYRYLTGHVCSTKIFGKLKKLLLGNDAVPMRRVWLDAAFSLNQPFPNLPEQYLIKDLLSVATMRSLFSRLPAEVRDYFSDLAAQCQGKVGLLLIFVEDQHADFPQEVELNGYTKLIEEMIAQEKVETILVKPHPINSKKWLEKVLTHLRGALPNVKFVIVEEYRYLSIEVILSAFEVVACTGIASSSMRTLQEIYQIRTYYSRELLARLYETNPQHRESSRRWLEEVEGLFIPVEI